MSSPLAVKQAAVRRRTVWFAIWTLAALLVLACGGLIVAYTYPIYHPKVFSEAELDRAVAWPFSRRMPLFVPCSQLGRYLNFVRIDRVANSIERLR